MGNTSSTTKRARVHKELERFLKPTGLYPTCAWDERSIRKLILDGKIAPRFIGFETKYQGTDECPICFMRYCAVNRTACCKKPICSECYLQVKAPRGTSPCPFCNHVKLQPVYGLDDEDKMIERELEVIALHDRISEAEEKGESVVPVVEAPGEDEVNVGSAEAVYSNAPLATVQDRRNIEAEVKRQFEVDRARSEPPRMRMGRGMRSSSEGRRAGSGAGQQRRVAGEAAAGRRAHDDADLRRAFLQTLGMPRDLQHVEELMLMEAIRQSMEEQARARAASQQQQQAAVQGGGGGGSTGGRNAVDGDTKEEDPPVAQAAGGGSEEAGDLSRLLQRASMDDEEALMLALSLSMSGEEGGERKEEEQEGGGVDEAGAQRGAGGGSQRGRRSLSSSSSSSSSQVVMSDGDNLISRIRMGSSAGGAGGR